MTMSVDYMKILEIVQKGLQTIPLLIQAGGTVLPLIQRLTAVTKGGQDGTVTEKELTDLEVDLDAALDEFNSPLPPK
jgi:hypothetical protein